MSNNYKVLQVIILIMCFLGVFGSFIIGINAIEDDIVIGLVIMFLGSLAVFVTCSMLLAFLNLVIKVELIESYLRNGANSPTSSTQLKTDIKRISKLEKLRAQGLITEEEYQQALTKEQQEA